MAKAKEIEGLDCNAHALAGMRLVLSTRLEEMMSFRAAALDFSDIEGVHDMRVASRRLRSLLSDFRPYLRQKLRSNRLRNMARALGQVRDQDVTIAELEKLKAEAPEDVKEGLNQIIDEHRELRISAQTALADALSLPNILSLHGKLLGRIERATEIPEAPPSGAFISFRRAGAWIIGARLKELYELGEATIYRPFEVERLHDMRIVAKRLRYAMELFAGCWGGQLTPYAAEVAEMQQALGDLHDCDVWIADLSKRLRRSNAPTGAAEPVEEPSAARVASIWLLQHYTKARAKYYRQALERWRGWETEGFRARLEETLKDEAAEPRYETQTEALNIS